MMAVTIVGGLAVLVIAWLLLTYNRLIRARNGHQRALAQIDVQLRRRHDLIPSLIETAKGYMAHERETLEAVISARAAAVGAQEAAIGTAVAGGTIAQMAGAENMLTQTLGQLYMRAEAYPDLKASGHMMQLSEELTSTENRVAYARQAYNDAVLSYNTRRQVFPTNLLAGALGFGPAELWEADFAGVRDTPGINF